MFRTATRVAWLLMAPLVLAAPAAAQNRPFVFTVTTPSADAPRVTVHYDTGLGERPFDVKTAAGRIEQRFGLQARLGRRVTLLADVGVSMDDRDARTASHAELLLNVLDERSRGLSLAVGGGARHESAGVDIAVARVALGRHVGVSNLHGNLVFEKPLAAPGRDAVDLISSVGWSLPLSRAAHVGVEAIGEDLEGFWNPEEAEGGARLLVGPSIRVAPPSAKWQLAVAGGPVFHASNSPRASGAERALPPTRRNGYAVRTSLSYRF